MKLATSKAVLIAWDMGRGPTFRTDDTRYHSLYRVYRDGVAIGDTCAEAFYDTKVRRGAVYYYRVFAVAEDGTESPVGPTFTVHVPRVPPRDHAPPTVPENLTTTGWTPSSDSGSGVLAYFVERDNGSQPWAVLWSSGGTLHEWTDQSAVKKAYRLRALDAALNLSEPSNIATTPEPVYFGFWVTVSAAHPADEAWGVTWSNPQPDCVPHHFIISRGFAADHSDEEKMVPRYLNRYTTPHYWTGGFAACPDDNPDDLPYYCRVDGSNADESELYDVEITSGPSLYHPADPVAPLWVTGLMVEPDYTGSQPLGAFADGGSDGWEWDGAASRSTSRATGGGETPRRNLVFRPQIAYVTGYGPQWSEDDDPHSNVDPFAAIPLLAGCSSSSRYTPHHHDHGGSYNYELLPIAGVYDYWVSMYVAGAASLYFGTPERSYLVEIDAPANPGEFARYAAHITVPR